MASKFFLEANDVVVNCDIARVIGMEPLALNKIESTLAGLLDFNFFVSTLDYNKVACILNEKVKDQADKETQASSTQCADRTEGTCRAFIHRRKFNS